MKIKSLIYGVIFLFNSVGLFPAVLGSGSGFRCQKSVPLATTDRRTLVGPAARPSPESQEPAARSPKAIRYRDLRRDGKIK